MAAAALVACLGCDDRDGEIRSYTVPKEKPPTAPTSEMQVPSPTPVSGTMQWDLPDGWTRLANTKPMRFATLSAGDGDETIEIAITRLGGAAGGIVANINRWRGQVGLLPASELELAGSAQPVHARGALGVMVDLIGASGVPDAEPPRMLAAIFPTDTHTWFIKTMGSHPLLETNRAAFVELCASVRFSGSTDATEATAPTSEVPPAPAGASPTWETLPDGWTLDAPPTAMSVASFSISDGLQEASLTITPLGGPQDLLGNINRWRRQAGLGPVADLGEEPPVPVEVAGRPGSLVDIVGTDRHILGVISRRGKMTWFYKLSGPDPLVASQRAAFEAFVGSIRFGGASNE